MAAPWPSFEVAVKVRALITLIVGAAKRQGGEVFEADPGVARAWIKAGFVEAMKDTEPETAVQASTETAAKRRGR